MEVPTTAVTTKTAVASLATIAAVIVLFALSTPPTEDAARKTKRKNPSKARSQKRGTEAPQYVAGLVNTGNTCFMNAVLQALASLPSLREYLETRKDAGHGQDSVTLALCDTIEKEREKLDYPGTPSLLDRKTVNDILSPPLWSPPTVPSPAVMSSSISLSQMLASRTGKDSPLPSPSLSSAPSSPVAAMSSFLDDGGNGSGQGDDITSTDNIDSGVNLDNSNDTSASVSSGSSKRSRDDFTPMMTASLILDRKEQEKFKRAKSPFMGLIASRVSCVDCGYTAAIRHSTFDNLSLTLPYQYSCNLEDCLEAFIHLDTITDYNCRKCTVMHASQDLGRKIEHGKRVLAEKSKTVQPTDQVQPSDITAGTVTDGNQYAAELIQGHTADLNKPENNKPKRKSSRSPADSTDATAGTTGTKISLEEMEKIKDRVDHCLATNIESDLAPLELAPIRSKRTTKQSMIAKPPQALCLHLNRSMITPTGQTAKNPCRVVFGSTLDFTRFTTSGHLTTVATKTMSRRGSVASVGHGSQGSSRSGLLGSGLGLASGAGFDIGLGVSSPSGAAASVFARRPSGSHGILSSSWSEHSMGSGLGLGSSSGSTISNGHTNTKNSEDTITKDMDDIDRVIYRLWAVVVHLGSHNSGHFVTYRRIPGQDSSGNDGHHHHHHGSRKKALSMEDVESKWWRISDEDVQIVDWHEVKNAEAYMLFFEKEETFAAAAAAMSPPTV
ncbi:hypothetical protein BGX31_007710 [Mortierella sp. GBA43]|nr:hypothetical protein BGX31_007710 [Mortierella sp. GBA43]